MGSFSIWHWLSVLLVVVLIFGTKKLRNIGTDMGSAIKEFRESMAGSDAGPLANTSTGGARTIENEVKEKTIV